MQFTRRNSDAIRAGAITVSFRNWQRPHVKVGGLYRLRPGGAVRVTDVRTVRLAEIEADDVVRAGFETVEALAAFLGLPPTAEVARVAFELAKEEEIGQPPILNPEQVLARLTATDRRSAAPWTAKVLALIDAHPATRAGDLAPTLGWRTPKFKANVRKLKALGLTQSLDTGYRLTDLGMHVLAAMDP